MAAEEHAARPYKEARSPLEELYEIGRTLRISTPRSAHAKWNPPQDHAMLTLIKGSNEGQVNGLVPIGHARMLALPFTFYRGAPAVMAYDLAHTPSA